MTAGALFVALLVAHLLGDWVLQTDREAHGKMHSWWLMLEHVVSYHLMMLAVLLPQTIWGGLAVSDAAFVMVVSAATHALLDRRWPVIGLMRLMGSPRLADETWGVLVVDQALHVAILGTLALAVAL